MANSQNKENSKNIFNGTSTSFGPFHSKEKKIMSHKYNNNYISKYYKIKEDNIKDLKNSLDSNDNKFLEEKSDGIKNNKKTKNYNNMAKSSNYFYKP